MTDVTMSRSRYAYDVVLARVVNGSYPAGCRMVIDALARELDVSCASVQEAVWRLEAEGLIEHSEERGFHVTAIDPADYRNTMQTLAVLEGAATGLAAPLLTADDIARATEINGRMRRCLRDYDPITFSALNEMFHAALFQRCPNPHLRKAVSACFAELSTVRRSASTVVPGRAAASVDEHDHILGLVTRGADPGTVEQAARKHRLATLRSFLQHTGADEPQP